MRKAFTTLALALVLILVPFAPPAAAGDPGYGPRLGYTHDTGFDQIHFGGQVVFANLTTNIHVIPSLELGFGDGTLIALNGDVVYEFTELASDPWSFYAGGGPLLSHFTRDGNDSTDFALSLVGGTTYDLGASRSAFGEIRVGLEDAPALKLTLGVTFF